MKSSFVTFLAILIASVFLPGVSHAEIFKCVGQDGQTSFQQTPCSPAQAESKVTVESGPRWEVLSKEGDADSAWIHSLDVGRIRNDQSYKRFYFKRELESKGKIIMSTVSEELFDCTKLRSKVVAVNGERREPRDGDVWSEFTNNAKTRELGAKIKAKVCSPA